jgi:hypothetical protein
VRFTDSAPHSAVDPQSVLGLASFNERRAYWRSRGGNRRARAARKKVSFPAILFAVLAGKTSILRAGIVPKL